MFMIMKKNFWKSAVALLAGIAAVASCGDPVDDTPEQVLPIFPTEVVKKNVEAGESVAITFDANLDWKVSIPSSEQNKYWLDDAGIPASSVSGKAGKQTVNVIFSEDVYYDNNVVCEVTLAMGGESKVIAELTRLSMSRTLDVYTAQTSEWGFANTYNETKAESLELVTFAGITSYSTLIKVVANYDWTLALPDWCKGEVKVAEGQTAPETLSGKSGEVVEILINAVLTEALKNGAEATANFIDAAATDKSMSLPVVMPAFADRLELSAPNYVNFNNQGEINSTSEYQNSSIGYILGMDGFVVRALEWQGEWHATQYADWVTATIGESSEAGLIKNVDVIFTLAANPGDARSVDIFVFPASLANIAAGDICDGNSSTCAVKAEYQKYLMCRLEQAGVPKPYISLDQNAEVYKAEFATYTSSQWWASSVNVDVINQYELTYSDQWSECTLLFDKPYASYKIFDYDFNEVSEEAQATFWLQFAGFAENSKGKITLDPALFTLQVDVPESFIAFYDENGVALAAICCRYTAAGGNGGSSSDAVLSILAGEGQLSEIPETEDLYMMLSSNLSVSKVYTLYTSSDIMLDYSTPMASVNVFDINLNPTSAVPVQLYGQYQIYISAPSANNTEAIIVLRDANYVNLAAIHYVCAW